jgi:quercetin dioxygenase-like cupin family protein
MECSRVDAESLGCQLVSTRRANGQPEDDEQLEAGILAAHSEVGCIRVRIQVGQVGNSQERAYGEHMKKLMIASGVAVLVIAAAAVGVTQEQKKSSAKKKAAIYAAADKATFKEMAGSTGVSMAVLWGDPDKGAHGTYTKFAPGYDAGMHTHTNDVWIVGIKGAYLYKDDAGEKRVGPGDFLRVPGGHKHWSGGDKTEGALFYEEGSAKFDNIPAK